MTAQLNSEQAKALKNLGVTSKVLCQTLRLKLGLFQKSTTKTLTFKIETQAQLGCLTGKIIKTR